jgi:nucleotide-binding universal stress UspA family protein
MLVTRGPVTVYADEDPRRQESEALDYLTTIERRLPSVAVERVVRLGEPVREILQEAEAFGADLIAVTTSGPSGHGRKALGSVAEQVFRQAWPAVLLYHPPQPRSS